MPTDVVVQLWATGGLPDHLPSLHEAVGLAHGGERVPVDVEVDLDWGLVLLIPREPLRPDTVYEAWGIDEVALRGLHWHGDLFEQEVRATFRTGPAPELLAALVAFDDTVALAFSEAIELESLEGRVRVVGSGGEVVEPLLVERYDGERHLVTLLLPAGVEDPVEVRFSPGVASESGLELFVDGAARPLEWTHELDEVLGVYTGEPRCGSD